MSYPSKPNSMWDCYGAKKLLETQKRLSSRHHLVMNIRQVGSHISKSWELPIYEITVPDAQMTIWARWNFYNWAFTVQSVDLIHDINTDGLEAQCLMGCYFEGFERAGLPIHKGYQEGVSKFSAHAWQTADFQRVIEHLSIYLSGQRID